MVDQRGSLTARSGRIAAGAVGGGSFVALANFIVAFWGRGWTPDQVAGVVGLISWSGTWISVCLWDIRGIMLSRFRNRRDTDVGRRSEL